MTSARIRIVLGFVAIVVAVVGLSPLYGAIEPKGSALSTSLILSLVLGAIGAAIGALLASGARKIHFKGQQQMNREASEAYDTLDAELVTLLAEIRSLPMGHVGLQSFDEAQMKWEAFRDAQASFESAESKGGTLWPLQYYTALEELTRQRLESLYRTRYSLGGAPIPRKRSR